MTGKITLYLDENDKEVLPDMAVKAVTITINDEGEIIDKEICIRNKEVTNAKNKG